MAKYFGCAVIVFFLSLLSIIGFIYFQYEQAMPTGKQGVEADRLAKKMLIALNYEAYKEIDYLEWTFKAKRHFKWYKSQGFCVVEWENISVKLNLNNTSSSMVKVNGKPYSGPEKHRFVRYAKAKFNNDTFWLVAPYKVFDKGVERRLVQLDDDQQGLLVTYTIGGTTPGDSYLWRLDKNYVPLAFQMWVDLIPMGGLTATWEAWTQSSNGAYFPGRHRILLLDLGITGLKVR